MQNDRNNDYGQNSREQNETNNSWNDESRNMHGRNHDELDSEQRQAQGMGSRGSGMNDAPMNDDQPYSQGSLDARSDNDDFNDSGFEEEDSREAQSMTFNEDEDTWEAEKRMSGSGPESDSYSNPGTRNNNWDATDQMQRTSGVHDDEQQDMSAHGRYSDDEQNRYGQENDRRNREELEE